MSKSSLSYGTGYTVLSKATDPVFALTLAPSPTSVDSPDEFL